MGLLDDLKSQAEKQQDTKSGSPTQQIGSDDFYREHVRLRMDAAHNFLKELVNQLNTLKLDTRANYPFKPDGKTVTLLQQGYKVYSDSIPEPRQITLSFTCGLINPTAYEIQGQGPVMAQTELLERYHFKYEKLEQRDQRQLVSGAKFRLVGPLQVKFVLQYDDNKQIIKLLLGNFVGPGTSQYNLKPEQIDEAFLDHLGKYILRKEPSLFKEAISDDVKAMLRKKLQEEQMQREAELKEAEEIRKAEEDAQKENSKKELLKKAVSQTVAEKKEKLKQAMNEQVSEKKEKLRTMFNKLKQQAGFDSTPDQTSVTPAVARENPVPPAVNTSLAERPTGNPAVQGMSPTNQQADQAVSTRAKPVPPAQKAVDPIQTNTAQTESARHKATATPKTSVNQNKPIPPKVFQASSSNPFLKPEDFEPVHEERDVQTAVTTDKKMQNEQLPPDETVKPSVESDTSVTTTSNPMVPPSATAVPDGTGLSLEPIAAEVQIDPEPAPAITAAIEQMDTVAESGLSLETVGENEKNKLEPAQKTASSEPATEIPEVEAEQASENSSLSLEDELARDLARLMGDDPQIESVVCKPSSDPVSTSDKPDFDLSSPDALEINFENTGESTDQDKSKP